MTEERKHVWCEHCQGTVLLNHDGTCSKCGDKIEFDDGGCCGCVIILCAAIGAIAILRWLF